MRVAHINELEHIRRAAGSATDYANIKKEIERGSAVLVEYCGCYCVLRVDADGLCVVCVEGVRLLKLAPKIMSIAKHLRSASIVYHTKRKALQRLLSTYNFHYEMTDNNGYSVYRMVLNGE